MYRTKMSTFALTVEFIAKSRAYPASAAQSLRATNRPDIIDAASRQRIQGKTIRNGRLTFSTKNNLSTQSRSITIAVAGVTCSEGLKTDRSSVCLLGDTSARGLVRDWLYKISSSPFARAQHLNICDFRPLSRDLQKNDCVYFL